MVLGFVCLFVWLVEVTLSMSVVFVCGFMFCVLYVVIAKGCFLMVFVFRVFMGLFGVGFSCGVLFFVCEKVCVRDFCVICFVIFGVCICSKVSALFLFRCMWLLVFVFCLVCVMGIWDVPLIGFLCILVCFGFIRFVCGMSFMLFGCVSVLALLYLCSISEGCCGYVLRCGFICLCCVGPFFIIMLFDFVCSLLLFGCVGLFSCLF